MVERADALNEEEVKNTDTHSHSEAWVKRAGKNLLSKVFFLKNQENVPRKKCGIRLCSRPIKCYPLIFLDCYPTLCTSIYCTIKYIHGPKILDKDFNWGQIEIKARLNVQNSKAVPTMTASCVSRAALMMKRTSNTPTPIPKSHLWVRNCENQRDGAAQKEKKSISEYGRLISDIKGLIIEME